MTADAALDHLAFMVGLRLMGPDARRALRLALAKDIAGSGKSPGLGIDRLERLDALLDGRSAPESLQDHIDIAKAARDRINPPFDAQFWQDRARDLIAEGFTGEQAANLIDEVRSRVDLSHFVPVNRPEVAHDTQLEA